MKLPNVGNAQIDQTKITEYLLSPVYQRSGGKAWFFASLGFRRDSWEILADALKAQAESNEVSRVVETDYGPRYHVDGLLQTPGGDAAEIRTVWQFDIGSSHPRLITAYPFRR